MSKSDKIMIAILGIQAIIFAVQAGIMYFQKKSSVSQSLIMNKQNEIAEKQNEISARQLFAMNRKEIKKFYGEIDFFIGNFMADTDHDNLCTYSSEFQKSMIDLKLFLDKDYVVFVDEVKKKMMDLCNLYNKLNPKEGLHLVASGKLDSIAPNSEQKESLEGEISNLHKWFGDARKRNEALFKPLLKLH